MIGFWEIAFLVILVVLVLFIPTKLPEIMRNIARAIKEFRTVMKETEEAGEELSRATKEVKEAVSLKKKEESS